MNRALPLDRGERVDEPNVRREPRDGRRVDFLAVNQRQAEHERLARPCWRRFYTAAHVGGHLLRRIEKSELVLYRPLGHVGALCLRNWEVRFRTEMTPRYHAERAGDAVVGER